MFKSGGWIVSAMVVLAMAGSVWADMMLAPRGEAAIHGRCCRPSPALSCPRLPGGLPVTSVAPAAWTPDSTGLPAAAEAEEMGERTTLHVLADRSDSLDLCLYALVSLGVLRSGTWVRRSSLGFVPEWYPSGVLPQIGHSHAVGPDVLWPAAACFVQLDGAINPDVALKRRRDIVSLWRCAQFTPAVLAGRAPPFLF